MKFATADGREVFADEDILDVNFEEVRSSAELTLTGGDICVGNSGGGGGCSGNTCIGNATCAMNFCDSNNCVGNSCGTNYCDSDTCAGFYCSTDSVLPDPTPSPELGN